MKRIILIIAMALVAATSIAQTPPAAMGPHVGDAALDFSLPYATRDSISSQPITLSSLYGKGNIILAFYPADWSGGCTREVCTLRDNFAALGALHAQVLALSGDYVFSHYEWAKHHDLPFALVSDHKHEVAKQYASYNEASGHDMRTVYVIDKAGKIGYVDLAYSTRDSVSFTKLKDALGRL